MRVRVVATCRLVPWRTNSLLLIIPVWHTPYTNDRNRLRLHHLVRGLSCVNG